MKHFEKLLKTFDFQSYLEFGQSLLPSSKYQITTATMMLSVILTPFEKATELLFGFDGLALAALLAVFFLEMVTGVSASLIRNEPISSARFSRFTLKTACYLVLIAIPFVLSKNYMRYNRDVPATILDWLNIFLVLHIVQENVVSILENLAVISGKPKTAWIEAIKAKFK